ILHAVTSSRQQEIDLAVVIAGCGKHLVKTEATRSCTPPIQYRTRRHQNLFRLGTIWLPIAQRLQERFKLTNFPNFLDAGILTGFLRTIHMAGPGFRTRIASRQEKDHRERLVAGSEHQGRALLLLIRQGVEIILLAIFVIHVIRVHAWLSAEENQDPLLANRFTHTRSPARKLCEARTLIKN